MKANLFIHNEKMEIRLANGEQFTANEGETKEELISRVNEALELDSGEKIDEPLKEVDLKKLKTVASAQLLKRLEVLKPGVETDMCAELLESRGVEIPVKDIKVDSEEVSPNKKEKAPKKEKPAKKEKATKKQTPKQEITSEAAEKIAKDSKVNVGKSCNFNPFKESEKVEKGTIKAVITDKRTNRVYYRILTEDKRTFHKKTDSEGVSII